MQTYFNMRKEIELNCCINCFNDRELKFFIMRKGVVSKCDYCESEDIKCIDEIKLYPYFRELFDIYSKINEKFDDIFTLKEYYKEPETLINLIQNDWNIFNLNRLTENVLAKLINNITKANINLIICPEEMLSNIWLRESDKYYGYFSEKAWITFCDNIKHKQRFIYNNNNIEHGFNPKEIFSIEVFDYAEEVIEKSSKLYRSRIGYAKGSTNNSRIPYSIDDMGIPPTEVISNGRANPMGINYLYTADNIGTVLAEVRSWKESLVSVAEIKVKENLLIVDLTDIIELDSPFRPYKTLTKDIEAIKILQAFSRDLSKPINPNESIIEYIPTQYICELIKSKGYDGIKFRSSLSDGNNVVLFNMDKVVINDVKIYQVKQITYDYEEY